jgi:hypothetical protein
MKRESRIQEVFGAEYFNRSIVAAQVVVLICCHYRMISFVETADIMHFQFQISREREDRVRKSIYQEHSPSGTVSPTLE